MKITSMEQAMEEIRKLTDAQLEEMGMRIILARITGEVDVITGTIVSRMVLTVARERGLVQEVTPSDGETVH